MLGLGVGLGIRVGLGLGVGSENMLDLGVVSALEKKTKDQFPFLL